MTVMSWILFLLNVHGKLCKEVIEHHIQFSIIFLTMHILHLVISFRSEFGFHCVFW